MFEKREHQNKFLPSWTPIILYVVHPSDLFFILLKTFIEYLYMAGTVLGTQHIVMSKTDWKKIPGQKKLML